MEHCDRAYYRGNCGVIKDTGQPNISTSSWHRYFFALMQKSNQKKSRLYPNPTILLPSPAGSQPNSPLLRRVSNMVALCRLQWRKIGIWVRPEPAQTEDRKKKEPSPKLVMTHVCFINSGISCPRISYRWIVGQRMYPK
jgi:hypothetical protein